MRIEKDSPPPERDFHMSTKKVAVVLDNPRLSYFTKEGNFNWDNCNTGKAINELLTAPRKGMGLAREQYKYFFAYPKLADVNSAGKPKNITNKQIREHKDSLLKSLFEFSPDLIIGLGKVALKALGVEGAMQANRGVPQEIVYTYEGQTKKIMTLITYNYETTLVSPYIKGYIQADFKLAKKYLEKGKEAFKINTSKYEYVDSFDRVKEIFELLKDSKKYPVVALDTETNSINPELEGAKLLDISITWEKGQGVNIPLKHKDTPFSNEQVQEIYKMINELMESDRYKVFHNGVFDIQFMYACTGLKFARNCLDTMLMHYIGISEEHSVSRGLKQLTLQYLSMGDYAKPLTTFKKEMVKKHHEEFLAKYEAAKDTDHKIKKSDYRPLVNEIDGGNFNYEWIPLNILYPYAAADTDATLQLYYVFKEIIEANSKWIDLIYNFYPKLSDSIALIQHNGIKFSQKRVDELNHNYDEYLAKLDKQIRENDNVQELEADRQADLDIYLREKEKPIKDRDVKIIKIYRKLKGTKKDPLEHIRFNPRSANDLKKLLFVYCGYELPFEKDFMTGKAIDNRITEEQWGDLQYYSVGAATLKYLSKEYNDNFINTLSEYKTMYKLQNDFIKKLPKMADDKDIVHTHFNITGTVTLTKAA